MSAGGSDAKFFTRGKIQEFRKELQDAEHGKDKKFQKRKVVLKKIVANITMGNDMSPLFTDVVNCLTIPLLEVKKMVYLFLVNYGRSKPELISYATNSFLADCNDRNPLIRALAIRTMSYIPLPVVVENLVDPLRHSLKDADPYVRKTAAICVAKLYMHDQRTVEKHRFIDMLRDLLADSNPTVVANAVAALSEIAERSDDITFRLNLPVATKLTAALAECSEWGQIYILDSLLLFVPQNSADAEVLAERIVVRLQHANSAVVLTAIKALMYLMNYIDNRKVIDYLCKKMGPPLVTLLSSGPEVQYVALRNILLIIQRRPSVLKNDVKVFFCKYNDPIYVKLAKLEIMYRLARADNAGEVLAELREYASEVDIDFVRKAVRSIGRLAIKVSEAADQCIQGLLELIETNVTYVVQEAIVVIKDIFRRYPSKYENIIPVLCQHLDALDEPEAKAAMIWIVGQYADRIENADELLEDLTFTFLEEPTEVQLALLTAVVKLFIHRPTTSQTLVQKVLKWATEEIDNPDLRDRGYMYWRLLSTNPSGASSIVLAEKPPISTDTDRMERGALDQLLLHTGTLASIYHKTPESFIRNAKGRALADSPALNVNSRRALIALPDEIPAAPSLTVAPNIPQALPVNPQHTNDTEPPSPVPKDAPSRLVIPSGGKNVSTTSLEENTPVDDRPAVGKRPAAANDPYAGLDNAFGGYVADQPMPKGGDDDDLLF